MIRRNTTKFAVSLVLSLLLLVQGLTPAGFMPASLASGWIAMLCPEGLPAGFLAAPDTGHSAHQHHAPAHQHGAAGSASAVPDQGHAAAGHHEGVDYCQLGSALDAPAVASYADVMACVLPVPDYQHGFYSTPRLRQYVLQSRPRGPPIV